MIIYKNSYSLTKKNKLQYWFLFREKIKKTIYFLEMEIGTFSSNRITTIICHTWNGVYVAGIGFGRCSVGPCPPTKCLEQIYIHRVTFSTLKSSRPHARIQCWHFSKFRFGLGNGIQKTPFMCSRSEYLHRTIAIACSVGTVSCSAVGFLFFSQTKFYFSLDSALSAIEICSTDWYCLYYILKPSLRDN